MHCKPAHSSKRAFTLIELLVVIAIIGLLASIVLAALNAARAKGVIAGAEIQSSNIYHALGDAAVLQVDFDDCLSHPSVVTDTSGSGFSGTVSGGTSAMCSTNTYNNQGYSYSFDGGHAAGIASSGAGTALDFNANKPFTVSMWINPPACATTNVGIVGNASYLQGGFMLSGQASNAWTFITDSTVNQYTVTVTGACVPGVWQYLVGTYDGTNLRLYKNGQLIGSTTGNIGSSANNFQIALGTQGGWNTYTTALIDEVRVFARAITGAEIKQSFIADAQKHGLPLAISR